MGKWEKLWSREQTPGLNALGHQSPGLLPPPPQSDPIQPSGLWAQALSEVLGLSSFLIQFYPKDRSFQKRATLEITCKKTMKYLGL